MHLCCFSQGYLPILLGAKVQGVLSFKVYKSYTLANFGEGYDVFTLHGFTETETNTSMRK